MGELGATYQFMTWKLFDHIPASGSISYKELAHIIEADEPLVGKQHAKSFPILQRHKSKQLICK
jgi:hypothetical protein